MYVKKSYIITLDGGDGIIGSFVITDKDYFWEKIMTLQVDILI